MRIEAIEALSLSPHFLAKLIQGFLTGYDKPCDFKMVFIAMPILMHEQSRKKLLTAKSSSRLDSLYGANITISASTKISGASHLAGYSERYQMLLPHVKQAIIVAYNKCDVLLNDRHLLICNQTLSYSTVPPVMAPWIRSSNYLGKILQKASYDQISYYMGVDYQ